MENINELPDELLVKILTFVSTKVAVTTSILSKRWESLWKSVPKFEGECHCFFSLPKPELLDFIHKNLPLRAPIIEILCLKLCQLSFNEKEDIKLWIGIAVSRCLRELNVIYLFRNCPTGVLLPRSLYTCKSLVTLKLEDDIFVEVPQDVCLPCLKTLHLQYVTYSNQDSLRLLLSYCPVLEDLLIARGFNVDNMIEVVVAVPTLQRLSVKITFDVPEDPYVIVTPSLKYFKLEDGRVYDENYFSVLIEKLSELEEADFIFLQNIESLLESVTSVKRLTLRPMYYCIEKILYPVGMVFNQLDQLKIFIIEDYWSKLVVWFLNNSPKLRVLNLYVDSDPLFKEYESDYWKNIRRSSTPECLKNSLQSLEFEGYFGRREERDFLSFIFQNACRLKNSSISELVTTIET